MRIAIVGSRDYPNLEQVREYVRSLPKGTVVVSGGARGVDRTAAEEAEKCGLPKPIIFRPQTHKFKTFWDAARARNRQIVDAADKVVAFHYNNSGGTANTLAYAYISGKPVTVIMP